MEKQVKLPEMGEGVESATVVSILVSKGDTIEPDQGILELETDKAVAEVPSPLAGTVKEIHVAEDQEVEVGTLLLTVEVEGEGEGEEEQPAKTPKHQEKPKGKPEKGKAERKPKTAKKPPEEEPEEEPKEETEEEAEEPEEEPREEPEAPEGEEQREEREEEKPARTQGPAPAPAGTAPGADIPAAPATRRLARELGVDLRSIEGTGAGGWITETDVKAATRQALQGGTRGAGAGERDEYGPVRREKLRGIRKTIAKKMRESKDTAAHVTHFDDADITELEAFRAEHRQRTGEGAVKLSVLPFVVRAVIDALKAHPLVNASLDLDAGEILYHDYVSIGVAVDTERGLVVPVVRDVGCTSITELAKAIHAAADRVRSGDFDIAELRGGTFTVSNLGSIGGRYATPVINTPESAILLLGRTEQRPLVLDGEVKIRTLLPLSLTYDHRLIDGAAAGRFLNDVVQLLQNPTRLLTQ